jgi:hypothetical protein
VPVTLAGERFGVLDVRLAAEPSRELVAELEQVAMVLAFALAAAGRATDEVELARRGRQLSLPAEIQWELLPRLALTAPEYVVAGTLEPAYDVWGDTFDRKTGGTLRRDDPAQRNDRLSPQRSQQR